MRSHETNAVSLLGRIRLLMRELVRYSQTDAVWMYDRGGSQKSGGGVGKKGTDIIADENGR